MRISDWSSDVCSSDLRRRDGNGEAGGAGVERTRLGRFFVSSGQRIQSLNLRGFFTESPVQVSLMPGLSTQGRMSAQVVNNFSVNLIGGYTAGLNGMEMAGVFNMNKKDVGPVKIAGGFNVVEVGRASFRERVCQKL